jgi:L-rhamnose mutarotase
MDKPLKKYCLALDLKDDPQKINTYIKYHQQVWQEINQSIKDSGIQKAEIYHTGNRLFMILEVDETFSFDRKAKLDACNSKVQEWESLMWEFQKPLPNSKPNEKWVLMDKIYDLNA